MSSKELRLMIDKILEENPSARITIHCSRDSVSRRELINVWCLGFVMGLLFTIVEHLAFGV